MTTTVKIHVNGRYRAKVVQVDAEGDRSETIVVEGNYEGSPNPSGEYSFHLFHPAIASFEVKEEAVPEEDIPQPKG
jgi:hypothetical protein